MSGSSRGVAAGPVLDGLDETAEIEMVKWHGSRRCAE